MAIGALWATLHTVAAVLWVGGIFFAFMVLRPASNPIAPRDRLALWNRAFGRFFPWVWAFIAALVASGYGLLGSGAAPATPGTLAMQAIGWTMIALFAYLYFVLFARLRRAVAADDLPAAAAAMARMRPIIGTNLLLGIAGSGVGTVSRYLA
jgi:uncharacterized membrane protein